MRLPLHKLNPASRANAARIPFLIGLAVETVALIRGVQFYARYQMATPKQRAMWGKR